LEAGFQSIVRWNIFEIPVTMICNPIQNVMKAMNLPMIRLPDRPGFFMKRGPCNRNTYNTVSRMISARAIVR
jgi:hypothetical protein